MSTSFLNKTSRVSDDFPSAGRSYDGSPVECEGLPLFGLVAQVTVMALTDPGDDTVVSFDVGRDASSLTTVSVNTGTGLDAAGIGALLVDEYNETIGASNLAVASLSGTTFTLTSLVPGQAFIIRNRTTASLGAPNNTTEAATAKTLSFGSFAEISRKRQTTGFRRGAAAVGTGTYAAKVATLDVSAALTLATGDEIAVKLYQDTDGDGVKEKYFARAVFDTNLATTLTALAGDLNAALPANSIAVTENGTVLTLASEVAGLDFDAEITILDASASEEKAYAPTIATANAIPEGGGIVFDADTVVQDASGRAVYGSGSSPTLMQHGKIWVLLDEGQTVATTDNLWVRVTAGSDEQAGALRVGSDGGDALPLSAFGFRARILETEQTGFNGNTVCAAHVQRI